MADPNATVGQRVRAALQRAMARIKELEAKDREPIAVVGMACRFPGGSNPEAFWDTLVAGKDMIRELPEERAIDDWWEGVPRWAGLLDEVDAFDPEFFGISPREANAMDPQHRVLLEVAWEALEDARIVPAKLNASKTAVFVGQCTFDYRDRLERRPAPKRGAYDVTGNMLSAAAGRISYVFGLRGPSVTVDTACSSSLVAIHLACQSLRAGESDLALCGGVNLILSENVSNGMSLVQALSPDGRSRTFDAAANGYVRGEGCGLVVLERLSDAERNGHQILGVIRGSAVNQDGRSTGFTAPNVLAQQELLREATTRAGLQPGSIGYVECHGTGTSLGDPIEVEAIKSVFASSRSEPLWLGAVKTNIGHLEGAAGIAGFIKALLALRHRSLPRNLHLRRVNPHIQISNTALAPLTDTTEWTPIDGRRIAGVSSFGIAGTNAHVIVEEPPARESSESRELDRPEVLPLLLSGRSEAAVAAQAASLARYLADHPDVAAVDLAYSLATTRTHFDQRACVSYDDLDAGLDDLAQRRSTSRTIIDTPRRTKLALLFTGQGAQRLAMGRQLREVFPTFASVFDDICGHFDEYLGTPLAQVIFAEPGDSTKARLDQTAYTQPALFAIEVALHRLFESWGVVPDFLLGHSIGELAAAHVAGVFDLADACKLVAARGRLMQALPGHGAMVSIQASEAEVSALLDRHPGVDIAGLNGPMSTVISGNEDAALALARHFADLGRKTKRLAVSHAFHSHHMDAMLVEFSKVARTIAYARPRVPIVSNVTGEIIDADSLASPEYWCRHIRQPVRFLDGVRRLEALGANVMLELGPRGVLSAMAADCLSPEAQTSTKIIPVLHNQPEARSVITALGRLHCRGVQVDWEAFFAPHAPRAIGLPTYPFQRQRYWVSARELGSAPTCLRYTVRWELRPDHAAAATDDSWLVVAPESLASDDLPRAISTALEADRIRPRLVVAGADAGRDEIAALLRTELDSASPRRILSLLALDSNRASNGVPSGLAQNLALTQALGDLDSSTPLWLATRSAASIHAGDPIADPVQATTWGFGLSLALEQPERWGGLIDLPASCDAELLSRLPAALTRDDGEDQLALRSEGVFVRRLARAPAPRSADQPLPLRNTVLITGGLGSLGAHCARWLARAGVEHLVLTSRRGLDAPEARVLATELEALGARVTIIACDLSSASSVAGLFDQLSAAGASPSSIIHSAGVLDDGLIGSMTPDRLASVLAPKLSATLHLHEQSLALELDHFILFSSLAGVLGNAGQSNYAAANAFLDALCMFRRHQGMPATAIAWGPWAEGGMAANQAVEQRTRRVGLRPLTPDRAISEMIDSITAGDFASAIFDVAWPTFARSYATAGPRRLLEQVAGATTTPETLQSQDQESPDGSILTELASLPAAQRFAVVLEQVSSNLAAVLELANSSSLEPDVDISGLGLDSLMAVELRQRLQRVFGLGLSPTLVFDFPSPRQLAERLLELLAPQLATPEANAPGSDAGKDTIMQAVLSWNVPSTRRSPAPAASSSSGVLRLLFEAIQSKSYSVAASLINALIDARRCEPDTREHAQPTVATLSKGDSSELTFYGVPSLACPSSPIQFARLAAELEPKGTFVAAGNPGFELREPLVDGPSAYADFHTETILRTATQPFALIGYSSGSWICLDLVERLMARKQAPAALILLDPGSPDTLEYEGGEPWQFHLSVISRTIESFIRGQAVFSEQELIYQITAMFEAFQIYRFDWTPPVVDVPTLFVHAGKGFPVADGFIHWDPRAIWGRYLSDMTVEKAAHDHFELIAGESAATARAIARWLEQRGL